MRGSNAKQACPRSCCRNFSPNVVSVDCAPQATCCQQLQRLISYHRLQDTPQGYCAGSRPTCILPEGEAVMVSLVHLLTCTHSVGF